MIKNAQQTREAVALHDGEGEARWWLGQLAILKATAESTGGGHTLVEIVVGPGYATPLHVHHGEDEGFWILDGRATFTVGGETVEARRGSYLFGPRDVPHKWVAGPDGARLLYLFAPAGLEECIRAQSVPADELVPPPADLAPPADFLEVAARYGVEVLG